MIKHKIIIDVAAKQYDEKIIKWRNNHCDYWNASDHSFSIMPSTDFNFNTKKNSSSRISTKILKRNSDFRLWKKNLNKIKTFIFSCFEKIKQQKISCTKLKKTWKKKRMINKSWRKNENSLNIATIAAVLFNVLIKQKNVKIFAVTLKKINYKMKKKNRDEFETNNIKRRSRFFKRVFKTENWSIFIS